VVNDASAVEDTHGVRCAGRVKQHAPAARRVFVESVAIIVLLSCRVLFAKSIGMDLWRRFYLSLAAVALHLRH
jgi:hypothetical protein